MHPSDTQVNVLTSPPRMHHVVRYFDPSHNAAEMASNGSATNAPNKPSPTANTKPNRLPAPTLFVGPPSRNTSNLSLSRQQPADPSLRRDPLNRGRSGLSRNTNIEDTSSSSKENDSPTSGASATKPHLKKASQREVEAKWKEMQNTLNEVELTAQSSTHVFGEAHARALDELRKAQIELARAWGRGNQDERDPTTDENAGEGKVQLDRFQGAEDLARDRVGVHQGRRRGDTNTSVSTALSDESMRSDVTSKSGRSQLEDETAQDIKLASERRAANEAYFKKVDSGVRDVVGRLEVVAEAMRGVESESRSLWSSSTESSREERDERRREGERRAERRKKSDVTAVPDGKG